METSKFSLWVWVSFHKPVRPRIALLRMKWCGQQRKKLVFFFWGNGCKPVPIIWAIPEWGPGPGSSQKPAVQTLGSCPSGTKRSILKMNFALCLNSLSLFFLKMYVCVPVLLFVVRKTFLLWVAAQGIHLCQCGVGTRQRPGGHT